MSKPLTPEEEKELQELEAKYESEPSTLDNIKPVIEGATDLGIGAVQGATFGLLPRAYAATKAAGASLAGQEFGPEYSKNLEEAQQFVKEHEERSPVLSTVGQVGGGLLTGGAVAKGIGAALPAVGTFSQLPMMQKLASMGKVGKLASSTLGAAVPAAVMGSAEGAVTGAASAPEGEVLEGAKSGALTGGVIGGGLGGALGALSGTKQLAGETLDKMLTNRGTKWKRSQQTGEAFKIGTEGKDLPTSSELAGLSGGKGEIEQVSDELADKMFKGYDAMRKKISGSIDKATKEGLVYGQNETTPLLNEIANSDMTPHDKKLFFKSFGIEINPEGGLELTRDLTPKDIVTLKNRLNTKITDAYNSNNTLLGESLKETRGKIDPLLTQVEGYDKAVSDFKQFAAKTTDVPVNEGAIGEALTDYSTGLKDSELIDKLRGYFRKAIYTSEKTGSSNVDAKRKYANLLNEMADYEKANPGKLKELGLSPEDISEKVYGTAKKVGIANLDEGTSGRASMIPGHVSGVFEIPEWANIAGKGMNLVGRISEKAGELVVGKPKVSGELANSFIGGRKTYGQRLDALIKGGATKAQIQSVKDAMAQQNTAKVNAMTNSILQTLGKKVTDENDK